MSKHKQQDSTALTSPLELSGEGETHVRCVIFDDIILFKFGFRQLTN